MLYLYNIIQHHIMGACKYTPLSKAVIDQFSHWGIEITCFVCKKLTIIDAN